MKHYRLMSRSFGTPMHMRIKSGLWVNPEVPELVVKPELENLTKTYGKFWCTWQADRDNWKQHGKDFTYSADRIIIVRQNSSEQNTFFQLHSGEQIVLSYIQNSDGDSDDDSVFPHLPNGYANLVEIGVFSIDLSNDEDTKSNREDDDERMREVTDSAIRRAFREDESRRNVSLTAETATRVMEGWGRRILY
ncbi:unnamed protein product [Camellia sinensis]